MTKYYVHAKLLGWPLVFRRLFERSGVGTQMLEVVNLLDMSKLGTIHIFQYEGSSGRSKARRF